MQSIQKLENYFEHTVPQLTTKLDANARPLWGTMNATQMLSHLNDAFNLSIGIHKITDEMITEKWEKYKNIGLNSERPLTKNFTNPIFNLLETTNDIEHEQAKQHLQKGFRLFKETFALNGEGFKTPHNMFGYLNYHEWIWFHYKHFSHHFAQFNMIEYIEKFELE